MSLSALQLPIANGNVIATNSPVLDTDNDTNLNKYVCKMLDAVTSDLHYIAMIPGNWLSGSVTMRVRWRANATTGNFRGQTLAWFIATGGARDGANVTTDTVTQATGGTALVYNESVFTLGATPAAVRAFPFAIRGDRGNAGDTLDGVTVEILEIEFEYTSNPTITKIYRWIPAQAMTIPAASGATRSSALSWDFSNILFPQCIALRDAQSDYCDSKLILPSNYLSGLDVVILETADNTNTGAFVWRSDAGKVSVGGNRDPALTGGTQFTSSAHTSGKTVRMDTAQPCPVTPSAGDTVIWRHTRLGSDGSDTNAGSAYLAGVLFSYNVTSRNPGSLDFDPASAALATSNAPTLMQYEGTNSVDWIARMASGQDQLLDFVGFLPSIYSAGGTVRVRWAANATGGNAKFGIFGCSPAVGSASDPVLTSFGTVTSACAGANLVNEFTLDISSGLAASDSIGLRVERLGNTGGETGDVATKDIDIMFIREESNITAG